MADNLPKTLEMEGPTPEPTPSTSSSSSLSGGQSRSRVASSVAIVGILSMLALAWRILGTVDGEHDPWWLQLIKELIACLGLWLAVAPLPVATKLVEVIGAKLPTFGGGSK